MAEVLTMLMFCAVLFVSVGFGWSIIPALLVGVLLFTGYGLVRRVPLHSMAMHAAGSMRSASTVLVTFMLIGLLTSLWRASGTIAYIVTHATSIIHPITVIPLSFLLCAGMSVLTGSSFASVATMGTICMSLGLSMDASPVTLGGAILAGIYVGDRCSPVSTSALLVAQLTHTNLFGNLGRMVRTGAIPFALSCVVYVVIAWAQAGGDMMVDAGAARHSPVAGSIYGSGDAAGPGNVAGLFSSAFQLHWVTMMPAVVVIVMALLRVDVRLTMLVSIAVSATICIGVQGMGFTGILRLLVFGYRSDDTRVAALLNGGGVVSMVTVMAIVCISAAYSGIFAQTHMLDRLRHAISVMAGRLGAATATVITAMGVAMLACNQTLAIMLTHQLCEGLHRTRGVLRNETDAASASDGFGDAVQVADEDADDRDRLALAIEDSAVVIAPLVPWSIAGAVPLATINAPTSSLFAAVFLYTLPISRIIGDAFSRRHVCIQRQ
ncbi:Na+/H+ antiporter NhaC family protein [Bifidobacterium sp. UTBIF-78]|uniref:Na+/H+ antiporter NhaC family protein n=1 Tax=Bifidobacterium sp. UTBIF-78 TaxID=1465263 RepID=UPI00112A7D44|nr:Na+/H+ antiporter NhaC family protein [Bifidobacterium sp. UTBIF-78]TPF95151.1 sodium:proton antiporter [Bifidobacterium sp. UTBIF-78]